MTTSTLPTGKAGAAANDLAAPPFGAFAPNAAQQAIISLARPLAAETRRVSSDDVAAGQSCSVPAPVDVQYQGASFRFLPSAQRHRTRRAVNPDYNIEELDFLRSHTLLGGTFIDIGANVGTYAMALARHVGPSGKVIAIEPHPVTHARLAFNRTASDFGQVILVAAAAGPPTANS